MKDANDAETRYRLIALRELLREGQQRAQGRGFVDRHVALVLLDGACERAMAMVAAHEGLSPKRDFHDKQPQLRQHFGARWVVDGWAGVRTLHAMRNAAQHHGGIADFDEVIRWSTDAERFVTGLIRAAFGVDLQDVLSSHAVANPELRAELAAAEEALEAGLPEEVFSQAVRAFDAARDHWRRQHGRHRSRLSLIPTGIYDSEARHEAAEAREIAEVVPFAVDVGEYIWFRDIRVGRSQRPVGIPVSLAEASRALNFVFGWILRWEAFAHRYDEDRIARHLDSIRPPTIEGLTVGGPQIASYDVSASDLRLGTDEGRPGLVVTIQVVNVETPNIERWARVLNEELREEFDGLVEYVDARRDGVVNLYGLSIDENPPDGLLRRVKAALAAAGDRLEHELLKAQEVEEARRQLGEAWAIALGGLLFNGQSAFESVEAVKGEHEAGPGFKLLLGSPAFDMALANELMKTLREHPKTLHAYSIPAGNDGWTLAVEGRWDRGELRDALERALPQVERIYEERHDLQTEVDEAINRLRAKLGEEVQ